jgi:hypothetical protein
VRGSPLIRALVAFAILAVLGLPLWRLTQSTAAIPLAVTAPVAKPSDLAEITLRLSLTSPARAIRVSHLGVVTWKQEMPELESEAAIRIPYPPQGVDLQFAVDWPEEAPLAAMRIRLMREDGDTVERSIWSKGPADEVVTFP